MSDRPPKALQDQLPHDPRLWARNFLRHPNDPSRSYDFYDDSGDNFLYYLTDDDGPMNPAQWGDINILLFARGCLKTWTCSTIAAWGCDIYPSLEEVATAPVDDQRQEVVDRFKLKVEQSGLIDRREKNNERHQKFKNYTTDEDTGEQYPTYSHLKSRSAWGEGDKLRGLHAHVGIIDESQDVDEGTFSTFLEAIDREVPQVDYFPTIFVIGTPKMANTFFHRLWRMSNQRTWDEEEKEWVEQADSEVFLPAELEKEKEELQEDIEELKEQLERTDDEDDRAEIEELIAEYEDQIDDLEGFTVRGWHIDQQNSPLHDRASIAFKKQTYSKRKFENEVKAQFYTPENDLITSDDVWDAFDDELREQAAPQWKPESTTFLGVDWGGGDGEGAASTVVTIAEQRNADDDDLYIRHFDVFDSSMSAKEEREQIDSYMDQYDVDIAVVDEGFGNSDRQALQDEYGYDDKGDSRLYGCWYGNVTKTEEVTWNRHKDQKRYFTASKTFMVRKMAEDFKSGNIVLPKKGMSFDTKRAKGTQIVEQLTAPYTDKKETRGGKKKLEVKADRNDDIFDSLTYVWIAANKVQSRRTLKQIASSTRRGY